MFRCLKFKDRIMKLISFRTDDEKLLESYKAILY